MLDFPNYARCRAFEIRDATNSQTNPEDFINQHNFSNC